MAKWEIALALLVTAALAHIVAVIRQIGHYRQVFGELRVRWKDARIGASTAQTSVIAIVVVDPAGLVRAVRVRQGRGIFGKFLPCDEFLGLDAAAVRARIGAPGFDPIVGRALGEAIGEIENEGASR